MTEDNTPDRTPSGQFAPGHKVKGGGRKPTRIRIEHILQKIGDETLTVGGKTYTKREAVLRVIYSAAIKGDHYAWKFIADREEGLSRRAELQDPDSGLEVVRFDYLEVDNSETAPELGEAEEITE